ncbi:hypothetical protein EIP91_009367 [Steccherinum ochraceum]|uniref:Uncharacterized protein n=1 Tax=Steccherinum ochraceum TaxID=92696 RepID=A0A4R0R1Q9_9APHY|nr:hypothetical protein EIP91_009367 [Steccherinum ochraceum]
MAAFDEIPDEVVLLILSAVFASFRTEYLDIVADTGWDRRAYKYIPPLTHVCRRWRTISLNYPFFWNDIEVVSVHSEATLETLLERAGEFVPLNVRAYSNLTRSKPIFLPTWLQGIFREDRYRERVRSWDFGFGSGSSSSFDGVLRELDVRVDGERDEAERDEADSDEAESDGADCADTDRYTLELRKPWSQLEYLRIEFEKSPLYHWRSNIFRGPEWYPEFPLRLLAHMPNLVRLDLILCSLKFVDDVKTPLPPLNVKELSIRANTRMEMKVLETMSGSLESLELCGPVYLGALPDYRVDIQYPDYYEDEEGNGEHDEEVEDEGDDEDEGNTRPQPVIDAPLYSAVQRPNYLACNVSERSTASRR